MIRFVDLDWTAKRGLTRPETASGGESLYSYGAGNPTLPGATAENIIARIHQQPRERFILILCCTFNTKH